jgi:acyl CoA:acetate/3-ketoacid CoA transferase beta subunit
MNHTAKGAHKILEECSLPKTGERVVDMLITEKAVFEKRDGELQLIEIANGVTIEEVRKETGFNFK